MSCGGCLMRIVCGAMAAGAGWLVTQALNNAAPRSGPTAPSLPPIVSYEPPRAPMICDRWQECRKVAAGPCVRVAPGTMRCPWRNECRVVRQYR